MKKILLLYITEKSGHHKASLAIEKALKIIDPTCQVSNINAFNYTNPILEKIITRTYLSLIKNRPEVWEYLYDNPKIIRSTKKLKDLVHYHNSSKLRKLLFDTQPDVVVCTQAFPCGMIADFKKNNNINIPLIAVLTDYAPHSYWFYDNVDHYIVPSMEIGEKVYKNGVPAEKIKDFGIPIDPKFSKPLNKDELYKKYGLDQSRRTVLIMGGGRGIGPIKKTILSLSKNVNLKFQIITVTGINTKLYEQLLNIKKKMDKNFLLIGYTENIEELMEIADLIVTKPGGLTISEAMAKKLPIIIIHPLPGQESMNTAFLVEKGIGIKIKDEIELPIVIENLLSENGKLQQMQKNSQLAGNPDSSLKLAKLILNL